MRGPFRSTIVYERARKPDAPARGKEDVEGICWRKEAWDHKDFVFTGLAIGA